VPGIARNARAIAGLGLDDETVSLILGGNALRVYSRVRDEPSPAPRA
jgi:hypothetical protein